MRLAVIMNQKSPWSRDIVTVLSDLGTEVHVIDFESQGSESGYMAFQDTNQAGSIEAFKNRIAGLHLIKSSHTSGLRYVTGAPDVREICRRVDAQLLLTLYGGGLGMMACSEYRVGLPFPKLMRRSIRLFNISTRASCRSSRMAASGRG